MLITYRNSENATQSGELNALFHIKNSSPQDMETLLTRIKNETRSKNVFISPGHPQAIFLSYQPNVVDLQDIRQDLARCGITATLVTC